MYYDVFISYAHSDNELHGNWVKNFQERLSEDFKSRAGRRMRVFFDQEELGVANVLPKKIDEALQNSEYFIPILSPAYLASKWCRLEFLSFAEFAKNRLVVNDFSRIIPVIIMPIENFLGANNDELESVNRIRGYLDNQILYSDFYKGQPPLPVKPKTRDFEERVAKLSESIIKSMKLEEDTQKKHEAAKEVGIFLGLASGKAKALRENLLTELRDLCKYKKIPFRILTPSYSEDTTDDMLRISLKSELEKAHFAILLFDEKEEDKTSQRIVSLQYEEALHEMKRRENEMGSRESFRILYKATTSDVQSDLSKENSGFLKEIDGKAISNPQIIQLPAFEQEAIKNFILDNIAKPLVLPKPNPDKIPNLFFLFHQRDSKSPVQESIGDLIFKNNHEVLEPVFPEDDPLIDPDEVMRNHWSLSQKALILLHSGTPAWCNSKKAELLRLIPEKEPPFSMAICVTDPDAERRLREVRSHKFTLINCSSEDYEQKILTFLNSENYG